MSAPSGPPPLHHETGELRARDGLRLHWQAWHAAGPARARGVLVNLHGLGDHGGLYPMVAEHFAPRGWPVYSVDLRGNGRSAGQRAYLDHWDDYRGDVAALLALVATCEPGRPVAVMGTSLGGLVALDLALQRPKGTELVGVIAVSPPLGPLGVPPWLLALGRLLSRVWPRFSLETGMDLAGLARDPRVLEAVRADPLFHRRGTARLATEVTTAIARVRAGVAALAAPVLVLHGGADRMVPPDGSRAFAAAARAACAAVDYREYPDGYHALLADVGGDRVLEDVAAWLEARLAATAVR